jgi:hypothetical protein
VTLASPLEVWRPVVGWEHRYEVSSLGRVRNQKGQILRPGLSGRGYEILSFYRPRPARPLMVRVHQLVCRAFRGPAPTPQHEVCHNDGTKRNNAEANLRWDTRSANIADAARHGHMTWEHRKKLTDAQVVEIRRLAAGGFNVRSQTISDIVLTKTRRAAGHAPAGDLS